MAVGSGHQALEAVSTSQQIREPYDLVILDMTMPDMDGMTVAARITSKWGSDAPKLVMLSSVSEHQRDWREVGIAAHLTKPTRQAELYACLTAVISDQTDATSPNILDASPQCFGQATLRPSDKSAHGRGQSSQSAGCLRHAP